MNRLFARAVGCVGGAALAFGAAGLSPVYASNTGSETCAGGSITAGTYGNLTVTGVCFVNSGSISAKNLTVAPGAWLIAAFGSPTGATDNVTAKNISVGAGSVLVLGCEPEAFPCLNDPNANSQDPLNPPTFWNTWSLSGNLTGLGASAVIAHHGSVAGNVTYSGGGGGTACDFVTGPLMGNPFYDDLEDTSVGGNVTVQGVTTCWIGVFRDSVSHNVTFNNNTDPNATAFFPPFAPDGNEIATNIIGGNLSCQGNDPTPQFGDSGGSPNTVMGKATGQCTALIA